MTGRKNNKGFTLAELLITIGIILILATLGFSAFIGTQRSMTRLEYDAIAKEIFIAAQNHLTAASSQGYLQNSEYGEYSAISADKNAQGEQQVWFVLSGTDDEVIRRLMLPSYALDATVLDGSYIIRYQPSAARVLDVFYTRPGKTNFMTLSGTTFTAGDYPILTNGDTYREGGEKNRERYNSTNFVIGWYGGEGLAETGERLRVPTFEIINAEKLLVKVTDPNIKDDGSPLDFASLKLILTGETSKAEKIISLVKNGARQPDSRLLPNGGEAANLYTYVLDDITAGTADLRFQKLIADKGSFYPGEDVSVQLVSYSNTTRANIAMSEKLTTNSLFADPDPKKDDAKIEGSDVENGIAAIGNIRHLENLADSVSDYAYNTINLTANPDSAVQLTDLSWTDFKTKIGKNDNTQINYGSTDKTQAGCFYPVSPDSMLAYDGQNHSISDVKVSFAGPSGLFGTLKEGSKVENLKLIDFDITATSGDAGALVGTAAKTTITNVVAYHTEKTDAYKTPTVTAPGNAGGLIGTADNCTVEKSAAALVVGPREINSSTVTPANAGGLIGAATNGGKVTLCYSGGHTISGAPDYSGIPTEDRPDSRNSQNAYPVRYDSVNFNVTGSAAAGGLIGTAGTTTISNSYSTCSASGTTAGGFVGAGGTIRNCYCTGLVKGTATEGAFAGTDAAVTNCQYFDIINERRNTNAADGSLTSGYSYLQPLGNVQPSTAGVTPGITAFDANAAAYEAFVGGNTAWDGAEPYDSTLKDYYHSGYNLKTVFQIDQTEKSKTSGDNAKLFVATHYGDWPAPEEFIFN